MANDQDDFEIQPTNKPVSASSRSILAILILAAVLTIHWRSSWLVKDPLWLDELHSVWVIDQGIGDVFPRAAAGNQAPLYFLLGWIVKFFAFVPGTALRSISAVAGGALVVLTGWTVWRWTGRFSALVATVSATVFSGSQLFYATEARPYELLCLVGLVHILLFLRWNREAMDGHPDGNMAYLNKLAILLAFVGSIAVLIHPLAILLVLAELLVGAVCLAIFRFKNWKYAIVSATYVFLLPLLVFGTLLLWLGHSVANRELWNSVVSVDLTMTDMARGLIVPAIVLVFGMVVDRSAIKRDDRGAINDQHAFTLLTSLFVAVGFGVCVATWLEIAPLALPRYCMAVASIPFVLTGLAIGRIHAARPRRMAALVSVVLLFALPLPLSFLDDSREPRQLATASGYGWNGHRVSFEGIPLRNEPWKEAWDLAGSSQPVFLLSNILEDNLLQPVRIPKNGSQLVDTKALNEYLGFPHVAFYDPDFLNNSRTMFYPTRTLRSPRFSVDDSDKSWMPNSERWNDYKWNLIVRGDPQTAADASAEFVSLVRTKLEKQYSSPIKINEEYHRNGDLIVIRIWANVR